ncbi:hypothetical protein [Chenggangzhangella methanolivorans]|uniref:YcxB family protein n=1 Tax=Chenggangzhangella methanolivorans TaxID=1437009 RepID=A0A9E6RD64_9HYPH|nr:hypothetical protein [Chenggangzhangella methanolivorans]QZN98596.1 hypothetical protein K6K41_16335 [Chenggangzhangella methanolivorans]
MTHDIGAGPAEPGVALGETRWRLPAGALPFRPWSAMQMRLAAPMRAGGSMTRNVILWLVVFAIFFAVFSQQNAIGLDAALVLFTDGGWSTTFSGWGVAGLGVGLALAGMAALAILAGALQGGQMRRIYDSLPTLQRPTTLVIGDDGAAQGDEAYVFAARWDMITEEFSQDGVWFLRLAMGGALYVEEATLGHDGAAVKAFVRERLGRPA